MLQQTRVETVVPYFERFLERFPDVRRLSAAPEEEVLALWSGLGYYTRARNLLRGAGIVAERFGGEFPANPADAIALPGIGPYTAAAILSIAYGAPRAVVDGNVARVLARLHCLAPAEQRSRRTLEALAGALLDARRPGDHNQAMMELGARVCTPRSPDCERCPVSADCRAHAAGRVGSYPSPPPRKTPVDLRRILLVLRDGGGRLLLEKGRGELLPHLWLPPVFETPGTPDRGDAIAAWRSAWPAGKSRPGTLDSRSVAELGSFRHTITHRRIVFHVFRGQIRGDGRAREGSVRFASRREMSRIGRSSVLDKAIRLEGGSREPTPGAGKV
jgi:A/G-specific adenine glycosylase